MIIGNPPNRHTFEFLSIVLKLVSDEMKDEIKTQLNILDARAKQTRNVYDDFFVHILKFFFT